MANNCESFDFNQTALVMSGFTWFQKGFGDLVITLYPTMPQNNESQSTYFMSNSLEHHGFRARSGDLGITPFHDSQNELFIRGSHGILTGYENLATTHANIQQVNVAGNDNHISQPRFDGVTTTFSPSGQNSSPFMPDTFEIWGGIYHTGSLNASFNNHMSIPKTSRNLCRCAKKVNGKLSGS